MDCLNTNVRWNTYFVKTKQSSNTQAHNYPFSVKMEVKMANLESFCIKFTQNSRESYIYVIVLTPYVQWNKSFVKTQWIVVVVRIF